MKFLPLTVILVVFAFNGAGCSGRGSTPAPKTYSYVDEDEAQAAKAGQTFEDPSKLNGARNITSADLEVLKKKRAKAEAAMHKGSTPSTKAEYVRITVELASKTMDCADLTPHQKYPAALRLYRAALQVDPKNPDANAAADTIVAIYKQMGKPVPD